MEVTYCIVNTNNRALLERCLDAVAAEREAVPFATEVLVLDNASTDGSAQMAREHPAGAEVIALEERRGKAANDSALLLVRWFTNSGPINSNVRVVVKDFPPLLAPFTSGDRLG